MPMGDGEKSKERADSSNVEKNFAESCRATEKKELEHAVCGSYGRGKKHAIKDGK